ncbi:neurobeachin isoform X4 [Phodopus roborovskii]|uniref:neurobeachin isoform X4 n=1 Tax=Phodopus roborovskii TaxID=109678 RepID=UPI0021E39842|nr:neurobeachin isoform X4 [Phodopus roborovskii]
MRRRSAGRKTGCSEGPAPLHPDAARRRSGRYRRQGAATWRSERRRRGFTTTAAPDAAARASAPGGGAEGRARGGSIPAGAGPVEASRRDRRGERRGDPRGERRGGPCGELWATAAAAREDTREETCEPAPEAHCTAAGPGGGADGSGPGAAALVDAGAARRRPGGGGRGGDNGTGGGGAAALRGSSAAGRMASDKPGPGLEAQPAALLAVGAGGGGGAMGEPRGAAGSGSGPVVLPAGMINPSVPIRNIRMKFAVLIGLIQVGEVSNRDIVETVLNLLVGGEFDLEMNFIIQDAESITCMTELLEHCDVTCQAEIWSMFTAILRKSVRNLQTSTEVGLIEQVLLKMSAVDDMIADLLVDMLGVLASYSITVKELKLLFSMLRGESGIWPRHAVKLLSVLNQMPQRHGPDTFFNFPGCSAAAIALPPIAKWPYQNGFTLNTWFRMDPLNNINVDKDKPYLYCFRTSKGVGYSAHFVGNCLIVTSLKSKGKGFQHCVKYDFQPRKWYMISIVHIYNRWRNSEIRCYVNGQLVSYGDMAWHVNTNDSYDKCFLGSSETADANRVFCGQLGAVYVFSEALNPAQIFAVHQLGPGYKSTFKFKSESDIHLAEHHKQVLYDGKLASSIAFSYNAKATDAQLCLESSPKENASIFVHSPHALMLQDVKAIVTHSIHSAIHSIGGIQVLFPLFAQLDNRQLNDSQVETTVCATLLAFLVELLKSSVAMQEQMLGGKGFLVIGYLLEKSSRVHITRAVLEQFLSFAKYLDGLSHGAPLLKQLCDHILFNPAIWIHTPAKVQLSLYTYLSAEFIGTATIYTTIRRVGTVLQLMHTLKYYYWVINPADSSGITPKGLDGPRPSQKEIISLRAFMLLFLKQLILKDRGVKEDELQSILNYLLTMHEDENIHDVLQLLVALMSEHPASMIPAFDQRNGIRVIYKLLASKSESIWVQALKVLGYFLKHLGHKRKVEIMHTHSLFTLLGERLMLHTNTVTVTTYNTLYEILTEQVCTQVVHKPHPEPDSTVKIQNPMILKVVATLLKNSTPSAELMEVRRLFLSDMIKLFSNSRENRRCLLQCSVWQDWMFSLGYINPKSSEEQKITEMVYNIFRILLYHAIKYEWGGWRVWVDTLSIAHSKVTYEAHKEYLAKMYEEYQRQEEENIKKGKKGNVSTISGLSSQTTGAKGGMEIREIEDLSQSQSPESETDYPVSTDTRDLLMSTKVSDDILGSSDRPGSGVHVEVHDLLVDIKAEKVEATEVKLDDMDLSPETLVGGENGALVEVESLLDNVYSAAVEKLQNNVHGSVGIIKKNEEKDNGPLITLADEKEELPNSNTSFLFDKIPKQEEKLLPELSSNHIIPNIQDTQVHLGVSDDLGLLAHMTASVDLTCTSSIIEEKDFRIHTASDGVNSASERDLASSVKGLDYSEMTATTLETESSNSKIVPNIDAGSIISDTERSDDGKESGKEIRKIQTTTTTQAVQGRSVTQQDRDLRVDLGFRGMPMTEEQRRQFSPGPRTTMFRIPEFKWSPMHQRLLTDLLFALETDVHVWRSHSTKSVMDFVNSNENIIFVHNTIHLISQMVDNIIIACGGILPLLSAATSPTTELENIEVTQGMSAETAVTFLSRLMAMVDVLVFASSLNFSEIEAEKNMSSGGLMRQCLRLVCCVAVRNCLECRQRQRDRGNKSTHGSSKPQEAPQSVTATAASKTPLENVPGNLSPIKDPDRLLQDVDINRLRAVVFRDVDDSKQAQFLALAVVYFISVLMVSKYRDILEPQRETARTGSQPGRNIRQEINSPTSTVVVIPSIPHPSLNHGLLAKLMPEQSFTHSFYKDTPATFPDTVKEKETPTPGEDVHLESSVPHPDSGMGEEQVASILDGAELETAAGPDAMSELLSTLSSEVKKSHESLTEHPSEMLKPAPSISSISQTKGINVKEILKSLVAAPVEIAECGPEPIPYPDPALKREAQAILPMQFHSFDRSVVVPVKKPPPGSLSVTTVGATAAGSGLPTGSTSSIFAAPGATPKSMINTTGAVDSGSSSSSSSSSFVNGATSKNLPAVQTVAPMPEDSAENMSITAKLERALEKVAPLLREIFVDFAPFLSRTLLGSHGQELLIEGLVCMKSSTSVVELVMLLCSQEWQNSIQKNAGLAFIELINEGRLLCHAMKDHIVRVANEAEFILNRQRAEDVHKHAEFESQCAQYAADRREEEKMCDHLISAAKHRDHVTANQLKQKILNILTNKHGAWGAVSHSQLHDFWRLDYWEDDLRRRRRFVRNAFGSTHAEALLKSAIEYGTEEDVVKSKKAFRSQAIVNQNSETELMLEGDDDAVSLLQEKEIDNLAGPVVLSTPAQLIAPVVVAKGTLSITTTEIYFEVDEDDAAFKKIDTKVLAYTEGLHGKWMFSEIRAVFSRRYLLQNTALEVFMANRTSVMFNFPDQATVKKVVYSLPRVGVGTSYGLPQARRISLATPRQLYKSSNMTQRWQRREISNFEYLMFLNTIAGRTYNDLNQYPVFPWVLTNYESEELDLTLPGNFRDLSKPIGALNPKRAVFYAERYETWEDDQSPPYHYNTHYSTATSALSWLVRIEPFTTFFLNANDGKFDHPDRTFSSISRSWRTSQRDTSDVKELIPEFYYLPEMFVNSNGYQLGVREDEVVVNDVDLPPWAKKPEDFVRINRMALESEFVSCQLHQWIDLIFGYKQRGPEAVRALNVFHYLTYEGSVNLDSITDPVLREAMEAQIQNFGQTPSQLLIEPHPPRSSAMHLCFLPQSPLMFKDQMQQDVIMVLKFPSNSPVTHVAANTLPHLTIPAVVTVTCSRLFAVNRWHNTVGLRGAPGYSLDQAHHLPIEMDPLIANNSGVNKRQITDLVDQSIQINAHCFVVTADNRYILICGFWDKSFRVYSTETGKLTQIVFGHWDVVTCLARSESYIGGDCYIVSGSRDATLLLWYWSGRHHIIGDNPNSSDYPAPRAVLTGHDHEVVCVSVCAELGLVISGAKEGPCLVHTITGDLLRALEGPENCLFPRLISVSSEGHCIIYYERGRFSNFSINGKLLAQMEINDSTRAILLSSDGQNLVTGGDNGVVEVWQACDFKQLYIYPGCDAGIRAMDLSHDQRTLITGMASGSIVAFNIDFNRWHYEHQNRY